MCVRPLILLFLLICCSNLCVAQSTVTITSDPDDLSRPISTLLDQLRQRENISVTYEDPSYRNSADIRDVTDEVARNTMPGEKQFGHRIFVPKGKAIRFVYVPDDFRSP